MQRRTTYVPISCMTYRVKLQQTGSKGLAEARAGYLRRNTAVQQAGKRYGVHGAHQAACVKVCGDSSQERSTQRCARYKYGTSQPDHQLYVYAQSDARTQHPHALEVLPDRVGRDQQAVATPFAAWLLQVTPNRQREVAAQPHAQAFPSSMWAVNQCFPMHLAPKTGGSEIANTRGQRTVGIE